MAFAADLRRILSADPLRMTALRAVRTLDLPDGWIGAGFLRDAIWDHLHGLPPRAPVGDVDLIWFDPERSAPQIDQVLEDRLRRSAPQFLWSVKNQGRMHARNGDAPYVDVADAMRHWPETATAVAVRIGADDRLAINAPLGLDDLFHLILRPTTHFAGTRRAIFDRRVDTKAWLSRYPKVRLVAPCA